MSACNARASTAAGPCVLVLHSVRSSQEWRGPVVLSRCALQLLEEAPASVPGKEGPTVEAGSMVTGAAASVPADPEPRLALSGFPRRAAKPGLHTQHTLLLALGLPGTQTPAGQHGLLQPLEVSRGHSRGLIPHCALGLGLWLCGAQPVGSHPAGTGSG